MAPKKKVPVVPLFSKLEQEYAKALLPKVLEKKEGIASLPIHKLWNKKASTAFGERPNSPRLQGAYDQFGKNVLERVTLRKIAASSKENNKFLNRLSDLEKRGKSKRWGGKDVAIKYDDDAVATWVKLNEGKQGAANRNFIIKKFKKDIGDNAAHNIIQALNRRAKQLNPGFQRNPYHKTLYSTNENKDNAFLLGLENLSNYAWKNKTTGRELSGQDLKNVMWPKNPEYHNLWKGDEFTGMVKEGIRKQHNNLFPENFNQFSSPRSPKKSLVEQQFALQNKEFSKIAKYFNRPDVISRGGFFNFTDDVNVMGAKNMNTISDVYGSAYNAVNKIKNIHPSVPSTIRHEIRNLINRTFMSGFKNDQNASIDKMMKLVDKMKDPKWAEAYVDLVNKRRYYEDFFKLAEKMTGVKGVPDINLSGFDPRLHIGHKKALKNYYELGTDINNLVLQGSTKNLKQGTKTVSAGQIKDELKFLTDIMEDHYYQVMGLNRGGIVKGYAGGGIARLGIKMLKRLAKKMPEEDFLKLTETLWSGLNPKKSGRYRAWAKNRWSPGYKWPYQKSRVRGRDIEKSHFASLSPAAKEALKKRYRDRIDKYIKRKREEEWS